MRILSSVIVTMAGLVSQQATMAPGQVMPKLVGQWTGVGVVNKAEVSAKAEFGPVLASRFTRLTYAFTVAGAGQIFEGHAYYSCAKDSDSCRGNWFDSQGSAHVLTAKQTADVLTSEWGDGTTPRGRTEYRLTGPSTLVVTDWIRSAAGDWRQFGRVEYQRVKAF